MITILRPELVRERLFKTVGAVQNHRCLTLNAFLDRHSASSVNLDLASSRSPR